MNTSFEEFRKEKVNRQQKTKIFEPLSNDFIALQKDENGDYKKIEGQVQIVQIIDIVKDLKEIEKIEEGVVMDTSLTLKEVKRGDLIYFTAMLKKPGTASWNPQVLSVISARIVNYWYGLNILNTLKK